MNLTTRYLGLDLSHPIVASPSPLSRTAEGVRALEDAGAAAVVLPSLFAEQIDAESTLETKVRQVPPWLSLATADLLIAGTREKMLGVPEYLDLVSLARRDATVPIIASLNADGPGEWTRYTRLLEEAGASALELNLYYVAADADATPESVEFRYIQAVQAVRAETSLPLAVKIGPYFSALPHFARRLRTAGAQALVLFNRFYEPDFDVTGRDAGHVDVVLSQSRTDLRLPLRWTAILHRILGDETDIALTGGVHTGTDALKALMAGATVVEIASELLLHGASRLSDIREEMIAWLQEQGYESLGAIRGVMSALSSAGPNAATEREGYIDTIRSPIG